MSTERFINFPPGGGGTGADPNGSYAVVSSSGAPASARTLIATGNVSLIDQGPGGYLIISSSAVPGPAGPQGLAGGADVAATYVVISNTGSLPNERALAAGNGIAIDDGGAGNSVTIRATGVSFDASASYLVIAATASLANERVLTAGQNVTFVDGGAGGALTINATTASNWTPFLQLYTMTASYVMDSREGIFDNTIMVQTTAHNMTASLPTASLGRAILFKDIIGSASNYPFMIAPTGGAKIDNVSASYSYYVNFGALKLFSNGTDWFTW